MTKGTVLIVDDEKNVRESLAKVFRSASYNVETAADGEKALLAYHACRPDIVLLDLNMPMLNGWEAFEKISTEHPLTPVVIITGRPGQMEMAAAARVGALMEKPLDVPTLFQTVERLIQEPLAQRLSRLTFGEPGTVFFADDAGESSDTRLPEIAALRAMRKRQLDTLRYEAGG